MFYDGLTNNPMPNFILRWVVALKKRDDWLQVTFYTLVFTAFALAMVIVFGNKGLIERKILLRNRIAIGREIEKLEEENQDLKAKIQELSKDSRAVERLAREQFGLGRENEVLFQFVPRSAEKGLR